MSFPEQTKNSYSWYQLIVFGLCMGVADIIPGISGGTIAFIMGFYEDLLNSIKSLNVESLKLLFKGQFKAFFNAIAWKFILGLVLGIVIAMASLAQIVHFILNHETYRSLLYAAFFGLILAAAYLSALHIPKWKPFHYLVFIFAAVTAFILTGNINFTKTEKITFNVPIEISVSKNEIVNYDSNKKELLAVPEKTVAAMLSKKIISPHLEIFNQSTHQPVIASSISKKGASSSIDVWIILCGAIAICAMILPGISGSYLLTILGMYTVVIAALADFTGGLTKLTFDTNAFLILLNMLIGIVLGAVCFIRVVSWLLTKYHDLAIVMLTGFMVGSLRTIWPFWNYSYELLPLKLEKGLQLNPEAPIFPSFVDANTWLALILMLAGTSLVLFINYIANRKLSKQSY
jgi:putative membrane protein